MINTSKSNAKFRRNPFDYSKTEIRADEEGDAGKPQKKPKEKPRHARAAIVPENKGVLVEEKLPSVDANAEIDGNSGVSASDISGQRRSRFRPSNRKTCSIGFRETIVAWKPILDERPDYMRMLVALISPQHTEDGKIVIDSAKLAGVMHEELEHAWGYLNTGEFLAAFSDDVFDGAFEWNPYAKDAGRARTVDVSHVRELIPAEIRDAWDVERGRNLRKLPKGERVYFDSGNLFSTNERSKERKRMEHLSTYAERHSPTPLAGRWLHYLNTLPPHYFEKKRRECYDATRDAIDRMQKSERGKDQLRSYLGNVDDQPRPQYGFSPYTVRLFDVIGHLPSLSAPVRRAFLDDAVEYDLASSQLAIVSVEWDIPALRFFLEEGYSIWPELLRWMGLPLEAKKAVKRGVYGLVYGAGESRIVSDVMEEYEAVTGSTIDAKQAGLLLTHPLMEEVWDAREGQLKAIQAQGYAVDCFGRRITEGSNGFGPNDDKDYSRSILAQVAQSREFWLLAPAIELAIAEAKKRRPDFRIVLFQHDGFSVKFRSGRRKTAERKLMNAVKKRAVENGYPTALEVQWDPEA